MTTKRTIERWLTRNNWSRRWIGCEADPWINPDISTREVAVYHQMDKYKAHARSVIADIATAYKVTFAEAERMVGR